MPSGASVPSPSSLQGGAPGATSLVGQQNPLVSASNSFMYHVDPFGNMQPVFEYTHAYETSTAGT